MLPTPYSGTRRKLVLGFDIGFSYSVAAYAFLDPGEVPRIQAVTKYLDNPGIGSAKVPSILYYDRSGNFRGVENGTGLQDDESFIQMRWWKFMLGPAVVPAALRNQMSTDLPMGKTIVDILSDFMCYLFDSTARFIIEAERDGELRWNAVSSNVELVLTHPNGWGIPQQSQLRAAAVRASIVPDTEEGHARVHFVTEGEAQFNFCATHSQASESLKLGDKVVVIDAGAGTIDIFCYRVTDTAPLQIEEVLQPKCLLQGGDFVTARTRVMVSEILKNSRFNTPEDITAIVQGFDEGLKRVFSSANGTQYIKFGSVRDSDPRCGINQGKLMLTGEQVARLFEPSIQSTVDCIRENFMEIPSMNSFAFLVGESSSSPWLAGQLDHRLSDLGLKLFRPDVLTCKTVSIGAVFSYTNNATARVTYGTACSIFYRPSNPEHIKRKHKTFIDELGHTCVPDGFTIMLSKGTRILKNQEFRKKMRVVREGVPEENGALMRMIKYDGNEKEPQWMDVEPDKFKTLGYVVADISAVPPASISVCSGAMRYHYEFDVVLLMGLTELKAQLRWIDYSTGEEKSVDAGIEYEGGIVEQLY